MSQPKSNGHELLSEAELSVLQADAWRTKPFHAIQARLGALDLKWCRGFDREGHVDHLEAFSKGNLCRPCAADQARADSARRRKGESKADFAARLEARRTSKAAYRDANRDAIRVQNRHQKRIERARGLINKAREYGEMVAETEKLRAQVDAYAEAGRAVVEAAPELLERLPRRGPYIGDAAYAESVAHFYAQHAPDFDPLILHELQRQTRRCKGWNGGYVRRYYGKACRYGTGSAHKDAFPAEHLADVLTELGEVRPEHLEAARKRNAEADPNETPDDRRYRLRPAHAAQLEKAVADARRSSQREWAAKSPAERAAIIRNREEFLRSLLLMIEANFEGVYEEALAAEYENKKRRERRQSEVVEARAAGTTRPHPDALKLTRAEWAALKRAGHIHPIRKPDES